MSAPRGAGGDPPPDGYCCGWYASYWNLFLFKNFLLLDPPFKKTKLYRAFVPTTSPQEYIGGVAALRMKIFSDLLGNFGKSVSWHPHRMPLRGVLDPHLNVKVTYIILNISQY